MNKDDYTILTGKEKDERLATLLEAATEYFFLSVYKTLKGINRCIIDDEEIESLRKEIHSLCDGNISNIIKDVADLLASKGYEIKSDETIRKEVDSVLKETFSMAVANRKPLPQA